MPEEVGSKLIKRARVRDGQGGNAIARIWMGRIALAMLMPRHGVVMCDVKETGLGHPRAHGATELAH